MTGQTLIQEIQTLPESLKLEVLQFVFFLKQKDTDDVAQRPNSFNLLLKEFEEYKLSKSISLI